MKGIFLEIEKCLGCKSCELACAVEHSASHSLHTAIQEDPPPISRISVEATASGPLPIQCHHCEEAPCMEACTAGAIHRNRVTGIVNIDETRCVGCWACVMVCPFGVIVIDGGRKIACKCDACEGSQEMACVEACPTGALVYCELERLLRTKRSKRARSEPMVVRARSS